MVEKFGPLLCKWRKLSDLTQTQLVEELRLAIENECYSNSDISKWEHGRIPPEDIIEELEKILSTPKGLLLRAASYRGAAEYRRLQEAEPAPSQVEDGEQQKFLALLQLWRGQLEFLSVDQLLHKFYFENWRMELERQVAETEEVSQAYFHVWRRHWGTIPRPYKAILHVESESLFERLKEAYSSAEVWEAQALWAKAYGIYFDAFGSWIVEVEYTTELVMGLAVKEDAGGDLDSKVASARELVKEVKRVKSDVWLFLRLLALIVACDLLLLGIGQQPLKSIWALELTKIKTLRDIIVLTSVKELPKDFRLTGRNRVLPTAQSLWDSDEQVKEKTIALVNALERLQIAQNNVRDKLRALELSLASYSSIPIGSKT